MKYVGYSDVKLTTFSARIIAGNGVMLLIFSIKTACSIISWRDAFELGMSSLVALQQVIISGVMESRSSSSSCQG